MNYMIIPCIAKSISNLDDLCQLAYNIHVESLAKNKRQNKSNVMKKYSLIKIGREHFNYELKELSQMFMLDRTTVMYALKTEKNNVMDEVARLKKIINPFVK